MAGTGGRVVAQALIGLALIASAAVLAWGIRDAVGAFRGYERSVTVKGLSEREVDADIAIWPLSFNEVGDELVPIVDALKRKNARLVEWLLERGFEAAEISVSSPVIVDRYAQGYVDQNRVSRYSALSSVTVYTPKVDQVLASMTEVLELGSEDIAIGSQDFNRRTEFLFRSLNDLKPAMVEEATRNAREVAQKFAADSGSRLGKIRRASQGQFSISDRDSNTPQVKRVRVVSTVEYYLAD